LFKYNIYYNYFDYYHLKKRKIQINLEDDLSNIKTKFIQFIHIYLEIEECNLGKIILINTKTKEAFSFPWPYILYPRLVLKRKQDELEISKAILKIFKLMDFSMVFQMKKNEK